MKKLCYTSSRYFAYSLLVFGSLLFYTPKAHADITSITHPTRGFGVSYQNITGAPLIVDVTMYDTSLINGDAFYCIVDSTSAGGINPVNSTSVISTATNLGAVTNIVVCHMTVPANYYYGIVDQQSTGVIYIWTESAFTAPASTVDNPTLDIFLGMVMFFISMLIPMWWFKRK